MPRNSRSALGAGTAPGGRHRPSLPNIALARARRQGFMPGSYDIIIIGAGHNGLVAAAYLARAGMRVLVLERRELVGGACVTEAVWPGFNVATASYVSSLFRPEIIRDLGLGPDGPRALEILTGAARPILDRWFESEQLKIALATDAIIGAMASPSMPGTAYVLFHHVMGECNGVRGMWGYVRGGMGGLSDALAAAARAAGAEIRLRSPVAKILTRGGRVTGVALADGTQFAAPRVASNVDAHVTFLELVDADALPGEFVDQVRAIDYSSASLKINVALSELPVFSAVTHGDLPADAHLRGTIHIAPTLDYMEQAYDDAKYGRPSANPILECTIPSVVDSTLAPPGRHVMSFFVQYAPYQLRNGGWDQEKDRFADRCFDILNEYAPNFKRSVIDRQVLSPLDLERRFGLTGGNIFQGAMTLSQLFFLRPLPGYADYRAPIKGLYLCGAATHPGGGVLGACGYNAAREILRDGER